MTFDLAVPQLNPKSKSTKDHIILILSEEWPLSAKEIYNRLLRKRTTEISYQAVHKTLNEMENAGQIKKIEMGFMLNLDWIRSIKNFGEFIERAYITRTPTPIKHSENQEVFNFTFNDPMDLARFILDVFFAYPNPDKKPGICHWWSIYPPISLSDSEYRRLRQRLSQTQHYMLGHNQTTMDKIFAENFRGLGVKVLLGADIPFNPDTMVQGDYVGLVYFSPKFRRDWLRYCKIAKILDKLRLSKLLMLIYEHSDKFNVIVSKNQEVADRIREQTLEYFKGDRK